MSDESLPHPDVHFDFPPAFPLSKIVSTLADDHQMDAAKIAEPIRALVSGALIYWKTEQPTPHSKDEENAAAKVTRCARNLIEAIEGAPPQFVPLTDSNRTRLMVFLEALKGLTKDQRRGEWLLRWLVVGLSEIAIAGPSKGVGHMSRGERVSFIVDAVNWLFGPNPGSLQLLPHEVDPPQVSAILYRELEKPE